MRDAASALAIIPPLPFAALDAVIAELRATIAQAAVVVAEIKAVATTPIRCSK